MPHPADDPTNDDDPTTAAADLSVSVERSGGFAGLVRRWVVTVDPPDADRWYALIDACPWPQAASPESPPTIQPPGADRFCWTVSATAARERREASLSEQELDGPWRALVDAVRDAGASGAGSAPPPLSPSEQ